MRPERSDTFARPAIAVARHQTIAVEDASDQIITGDENELPDGSEDIGRCRVALPSTPLRQPQLAMNAAGPMDQQDDLGGVIVDVGDNLMNEGAHDALLETCVGLRGIMIPLYADCGTMLIISPSLGSLAGFSFSA